MLVLGHIAGLPVQESLAYVAPVLLVVGWIYWAGHRERRRGEQSPGGPPARPDDLDALLDAPETPPAVGGPRPARAAPPADPRST